MRAAARLFAAQGYHATSMDDLSAATGLAPGGLYHYIERKEQLLIAICDELMEPLLERAGEVVGDPEVPAEQRLRALVRVWVAHVVEHRDHMVVFVRERGVIEREAQWRAVRRSRERFEALVDELLAAVQAHGGGAFDDRRLALLALLGMVNHLPSWYRPRGRLSPAQIADGFCDLLLASHEP